MREYLKWGSLLSICATLSFTSAGFAQLAPFIEPIDNADLRPEQSAALKLLSELPTTQDAQVVKVNPQALADGKQFSMRFKTQQQFTIKNVSKTLEGDKLITWSGAAGDARPGTTTMAVAENNVVGFVQAPDGPYRIWPIGGGLSAVIKVDPTKLPPEHPPEFKEKMGGGSNRGDARPGAAMHCPPVKTKPTTISVLVAYTPAVLSKVPLGLTGITGLVNTAIAEANQSYQNSGIDINLVAAPAVPVAIKYQETGVMAADVDAFSKMADVAKARATNHSNVAVLLVAGGKYCGWSQEIMATRATAFSVVYWDCAIGPQYSFGHEIGHLQGARHNPEEDSASFPFPYGHGFLDLANKRRTMMAYDCPAQNCSRQPEWARPTLWGNVTVSNDARVLNETATCISNF